jgi:hypothetical protein
MLEVSVPFTFVLGHDAIGVTMSTVHLQSVTVSAHSEPLSLHFRSQTKRLVLR